MKRHLKFALYIFLILSSVLGVYVYQNKTIEVTLNYRDISAHQNTAIFAAYSTDGSVSDYVITYLKALKEIAPNIIYITDNPIKRSSLNKLKPYINHIEAKRHGEYDWGSYKRGFNWLKENKYLSQTNLLIFANDSSLLVTDSFIPILKSIPQNTDFYGITANQDGTYHLQSYFLILTPKIYNHPALEEYLNRVKPEKDGLTVAYRYEVPFTRYFENLGFRSGTYIPYQNLSHLPLNDKNCYPHTLLSQYHLPLLKMRTFTNRLNVQEPRRMVFKWLKENAPKAYQDLIAHLKHIKSPYLKENHS